MQVSAKNKKVLLAAIVGLTGFLMQMFFTLNAKLSEGHSLLYSLNYFFSFFTIIINFFLCLFLLTYGLFPDSKFAVILRKSFVSGGMCLYILVVGIIFYALLFKDVHVQGFEALATHILHAFMPGFYLYFWYFHLRDSTLKYSDGFRWLVVPVVYFVYLIIRGQLIGKYPYFFVNVDKFGWMVVAIYAVAILSFFFLLGALLIFIDRQKTLQSK
jgi:hypothetical protein